MSKPKKTEPDVVYPPSDRYKSAYSSWQHFVMANVPEDKYPLMREQYLK
jgi:hypothetical protein